MEIILSIFDEARSIESVLYGMEWNGMEWNGMEWNGMELSQNEEKIVNNTADIPTIV